MIDITVIGSDSFIANQFILEYQDKFSMRLFSIKSSGKQSEIIIPDLFSITKNDLVECNCVINFTAIVHRPDINDNDLYEKINTNLPIYLAAEAKKAGVKHFIQMSTIAVYEETEIIDENSLENPSNIYGKTKLEADKILLSMQNENFNVSIIRPPMVYGGGNAPGNMMKLINASKRGIPMPFKGVKNERDFINVRNLILAINSVIENKIFGVVIPTDRQSISTEEIIRIVKKYSKSTVRLNKVPLFILALIKKINPKIYLKVFGSLKVTCNIPYSYYKPESTIEEGIKEMVNLN